MYLLHKCGAGIAVAFSVLCVGCGTQGSASSEPSVDFDDWIGAVIHDADSGGASEGQIAILERSQASGAVSFEDAAEANEATVACLLEAGFTVETRFDETYPGFEVPGFRASDPVGLTADQASLILEQCEKSESFFVNYAYQMQPAALEAADAAFESARAEFIQCLEREGVSIDPDSTEDELIRAGADLLVKTMREGEPVDCWDQAGIG